MSKNINTETVANNDSSTINTIDTIDTNIIFSSEDKREIYIFEAFTEELAKTIFLQLAKWRKEDNDKILENDKLSDKKELNDLLTPITIIINSYGGDTIALCTIYDAIREMKCEVNTKGYGMCGSAGFYLFCIGNKRSAGKHVSFIHHEMSDFNVDYASKMNARNTYNAKLQEKLYAMILDNTKITKSKLKEYEAKELYLTYEEALDYDVVNYVEEI